MRQTRQSIMSLQLYDTLTGQKAPFSPADPDHAVLAIQRYRADDVRPLDPEDVGVVDQQ